MSENIPHYHDQPATLDPRVEIPEDAEQVPRAMGHDTEEKAADVAEAAQRHKQGVEEAARNAEVGPGDPTVRLDPETGEQIDSDDDAVPDGTVDEVLDWVGDDRSRASRALTAERAGQNRTTLVSKLEAI
jgi:hypothetical protein